MSLHLGLHFSLVTVCLLSFATAASGKVPTFRTEQYTGGSSLHAVEADLNEDGALDFVVGNQVWLSNGDGTYHSAGIVNVRGDAIATADFDSDSHADLVFVASGAQDFQIAYGTGNGTFRTVTDYTGIASNFINMAVAADFNRDGKVDLAVLTSDALNESVKRIYTLVNTGTNFSPQGPWAVETAFHDPVTGADDPWNPGDFVLGDFDSDGNADVAYSVYADSGGVSPVHTKLVALFGNGTQSLGSTLVVKDSDGFFSVASSDMDQDARSDLAGAYWGVPCQGNFCTGINVFYGSPARTFTEKKSANRSNVFLWNYPAPADYNGDHRPDIALISIDAPNNTFGISVATQTTARGFAVQPYYMLGNFPQVRGLVPARFLVTGDYDRDRKPDLMTVSDTDRTLFLAVNTTSALKFPACSSTGARSVHVCAPVAGTTVHSPVSFSVGATNFTPLRKIEVWVDGMKKKETFFSYSVYSYLDTKISMAPGSHNVSVFAVGYDSQWIKNSLTINVIP